MPGEEPQEPWRAEQADTLQLDFIFFEFPEKEAAQRILSQPSTRATTGGEEREHFLVLGDLLALCILVHVASTAAAAAAGCALKEPTTPMKEMLLLCGRQVEFA